MTHICVSFSASMSTSNIILGMTQEAENRQISISKNRQMVTSRPSSLSRYARSWPDFTSTIPLHSGLPSWTTVPFGIDCRSVTLRSRSCWLGVSLFQMGKYSENSMSIPPLKPV